MSEAAVVNIFTVARILLVGGIMLVYPLITRKGLLFGVYVGEEFAAGDAARGSGVARNSGCLECHGWGADGPAAGDLSRITPRPDRAG